jgi:hypothetical protein
MDLFNDGHRGKIPDFLLGSDSLFLTLAAPLRVQTRDLAGHNPHFAGGCSPNADD